MSADRTLVVLPEPFSDALVVEQMAAWHLGRLLRQVLTADRAPGELLTLICDLAVLVSDVYLLQAVYCLLAGRWGAGAASLLLGQPHYVLEDALVVEERAEVEVQVARVYGRKDERGHHW